MIKKVLSAVAVLCFVNWVAIGQNIGIGTATPNASAVLDITHTSKGLLIPRMTIAGLNAIGNPARGLMVYDSAGNQLMVNMGTPAAPNWQTVVANSGWGLSGNSGINPVSQFIGTTDNHPLRFRINNTVAGELNPSSGDVYLGVRAGSSVTTGYSNTAFGTDALKMNTTRHNLVAIGDSALYNNGSAAPLSNFDGVFNVAMGSKALYSNTVGGFNIAVGYQSLYSNTTSSTNIAIGNQSLYSNKTGYYNSAVGHTALYSNTTGAQNTANGYQALYSNTTGMNNIANGVDALYHNTTGIENTAAGFAALFSDSSGSYNTATGGLSLHENTNGAQNTANGYMALYFNTIGNGNTANGYQSLYENTIGAANSASGWQALYTNKDGSSNTALGYLSLPNNSSGSANTAVGVEAMNSNYNGYYNTAIGVNALWFTTNAYYNTAVGYNAGSNYDLGYNNTILGANCDAAFAGAYNDIAIGQGVTCTDNSQARIGNSSTYSIGGYANWTNISDGRYKKNLKEDVKGLEFIMKLRPVTYNLDITGLSQKLNENRGKVMNVAMKTAMAEKELVTQTGFVAQEVEQAAAETGYKFSGVDKPKTEAGLYGLRYAEFVVPLVKAVQEQQQIIQDLKRQNADLVQRMEKLESLMNAKSN